LIDGTPADLGLVGEVQSVNPSQLLELLDEGIVPVVAPISSEEDLVTGLNVNADFAASAIAAALGASALIVMTDVAGIYRNWPDKDSLIKVIGAAELESIKGGFAEGMAPKVQAALDALSFGAKAVRIIDGTDPHSFASAFSWYRRNIGGCMSNKKILSRWKSNFQNTYGTPSIALVKGKGSLSPMQMESNILIS
jgi:acetylglutamate kinase